VFRHVMNKSQARLVAAGIVLLVVLLCPGVLHMGNIRFTPVPNYDLLQRDVQNSKDVLHLPAQEFFPEEQSHYSVFYTLGTYGGKTKGYNLYTKGEGPSYSVRCVTSRHEDVVQPQPNATLCGVEVKMDTSENKEQNRWSRRIDFSYEGCVYWVRCQSDQGPVEGAQERLEAIAVSILEQG